MSSRSDIPFFLVLIPFISAFNYYLTYSSLKPSWFLLLTYAIDTGQGYVAWWGVRSFIMYLDRKWPYGPRPGKRILVQLIGTLVIGLIIVSLLTELVSWIAKGKPAPLNFYTMDLVIISIWFFVINGFYVGFHFYNVWQNAEAQRLEEIKAMSAGLVVRQGKQDIRLPLEEIAGFFVDAEYVAVCHVSGKKYLLDQSLDSLEKKLPSATFFRLNRQYMLHRDLVNGFRREENGKLTVLVKPHESFPAEVLVSRTKAQSFKRWFQPE